MPIVTKSEKPVGRARIWRLPPPSCEVKTAGLKEVADWLGLDYQRVRAAAIRIQTDGDRFTSPEAEALRKEFPELCERVPIPPEVAP